MATDNDRLAAIRARRAAATPGKWEWSGATLEGKPMSDLYTALETAVKVVVIAHDVTWDCDERPPLEVEADDAAFIANAPADIDYLLTALTAANAEVARLEGENANLGRLVDNLERDFQARLNEIRRLTVR